MTSIRDDGIEQYGRYYGTYVGYVRDNEDEASINQLLVYVPEVMGPTGKYVWALPRNTFAGKNYGAQAIPQVGDTVWVTYRQGHPRFPLWEHGYYGKGEKPEEFSELDTFGFITPGGMQVLLKDSDASVLVKTPDGNSISIKDEDTQIKLENKDGTLLELKGKELLVNGGDHLTIGEELKNILEKLHEHLTIWSPVVEAGAQCTGLGATSGDPTLVQWKASLEKFLSKWS